MKHPDNLRYFLSIKVTTNSIVYYLSQDKYTADPISHTRLTNDKTVITPFEANTIFAASYS